MGCSIVDCFSLLGDNRGSNGNANLEDDLHLNGGFMNIVNDDLEWMPSELAKRKFCQSCLVTCSRHS